MAHRRLTRRPERETPLVIIMLALAVICTFAILPLVFVTFYLIRPK